MSQITTHVLDTAEGRPARGIPVRLESGDGTVLAKAQTDTDGRCRELGPESIDAGTYRLVFETEAYLGPDAFFPQASVTFRIDGSGAHYHIPLLLSPFAFSSYRGS